jgi:hypothetical protein
MTTKVWVNPNERRSWWTLPVTNGVEETLTDSLADPALIPPCLYMGRTSTTSGTKWRSRFWMPCLSVAVDDGQPEHDPFMLR